MVAQDLGLHDVYQQVKTIAYGIWRKRWYMLATAWVISLLGWGFVSTMPYKYEANARVFVDAETILPSIAKNLNIDIDTTRKVDLVRRTLISRPNLEKIIRLNSYLEGLTVGGDGAMNALISQMQRDIRVVPLEDGMYRIQYEIDEKRLSDRQRAEVAKNVVNNLLSFFLERSADGGSGDLRKGKEFLESNIQGYAERLTAAEAAHAKFLQDNLDYIGGDNNFLTRLERAKTDLRKTRSLIAELKVTQQTLQEQIQNVPPTIREAKSATGRSGSSRDPLEERLADLQKKMDQLRVLGFKDKHPDIVNVGRQLAAVQLEMKAKQEAVAAEIREAAETGRSSSLTTETPNRLYEQLMLENVQTLAQVNSMQQRETEQTNLVADLEEKAKRVPEIEAEESQLKRDYSLIRKTYNDLLKEKQALELRAEIEGSDQSVTFKIVEEPQTPRQPSGPPRILFMSATLVGAIAVGLAVALVFSQLRPVIVTVEQLRGQFNLPVLGNITRSMSEQETRQRSLDLLIFAGMSVLLFVVFTVFIAIDIFGAPTLG